MDRAAWSEKAQAWCKAWNRRDLEAIMAHYADDIELCSPLAAQRYGLADGVLRGKAAVRRYFEMGAASTTLHFTLVEVLLGVEAVFVLYRRETGALVCDMSIPDADGRIRRMIAGYGPVDAAGAAPDVSHPA